METCRRAHSLCFPSLPAAYVFERLFFLRKFTEGHLAVSVGGACDSIFNS